MAGNALGTYYIQIEPSARGVGAKIAEELDGSKAGEDFGTGFLGGIGNIAIGTALGNIILAGLQMAAEGARQIFTEAFEGFADYQQFAGGIEKLYGDASGRMMELANEAYRTSGMSANQYMENATSFSAALINSLGGDVDAAAEMTDVAMRALSDNANTFGTDMDTLSTAVRNFSRGNYTMLDSLSLGYAGSKEGMEQLIADANEYARSQGLAGDLVIDSFADQVRALELIQEKQGIAGTTAKEAANTVSGSLGMLSSSWSNFLTGLGNSEADMGMLIQNLIESLSAAASNVIPLVIQIGTSAISAIPTVISEAFGAIVAVIDEQTGGMASGFLSKVEAIIAPIRDKVFPVIQEAWEHVFSVAERIAPVVSALAEGAMKLLAQAAEFLGWAFQQIQPVVGPVVDILGGALTLALQGVTGFVELLSAAFQGVADVVGPVIETILDGFEGLMEDLGPIFDTIGGFFTGIGDVIQDPLGALGDFVFGTDDAAKATEDASRDMARSAKQGYGKVASEAKTATTSMVSSTQSGMSQVYNSVRSGMDAAASTTKSSLQTISSDASSQFQKTQQSAQTAFNAVKSTIGNSMSGALSNVKTTTQTIQSTINGVKGKTVDINAATNDVGGIVKKVNDFVKSAKGTTVDINVRKTGINGIEFTTAQTAHKITGRVYEFAQGGIINAPVFSLMGEAGTEAVLPLSPRGLKPFAQAMAEEMDVQDYYDKRTYELLVEYAPAILRAIPNLNRRDFGRMSREAI